VNGVVAEESAPPSTGALRPASAGVAMFASLAVRNYRLYFWGQSVSVGGNWIQNVALGWLVLQISHSGTALGILTAMRFLPTLVLGPWAGLVADRSDRRRILFHTQLHSGTVSGVLALVVALHWNWLPLVYGLALILGLLNVIANPARQTVVNDLVPQNLLPNAIALNSISLNVARVLGPLAAGAIIAAIGVAWCFTINAISFVAVLVSLVAMRASELYPQEVAPRERGQLRAGFRYMLATPEVFVQMVMIAVIGAFTWEFPVTLPLVATGTFGGGAWTYGALLAALGAGATGAGLWVARAADTGIRASALTASYLGVFLLAAAFAPDVYVEIVLLVLVGWLVISFNVRAKSALQVNSTASMRGRVMAIWAVAWQGTTPIGGPIVGWLGQHAGPRWSLVAGAVPALGIGLSALAWQRRHVTAAAAIAPRLPAD
jgi:MFS family permease